VLVPTLLIDPASRARFEVLQSFEGTVLEVRDSDFTARLVDRTDASKPAELADFPLEEVSDDDRELIHSGGVFYLSLGYRVHPWGQKERTAAIVFRRLPAWTHGALRRSRERAAKWQYMFDDDAV
jgi:hypothetical protein